MAVSTVSSELLIFYAIKFELLIHYCKPECRVAKLDRCLQGQGHSEDAVSMDVCPADIL